MWAQANREDLKLAIADIGSNEQVSEDWISSTPFFLSRFPAVRRGKPRMLSERYQKDGPEHQVLQYLQYLPWLNLQGTPTYREYKDHLALCLDGKVAVVASCQVFPGFWKWESECRQGKKVDRFSTLAVFRIRVKIPFIEGTKLKPN